MRRGRGPNIVVLDLDHAALETASARLPRDRLLIQVGDTSKKETAAPAIAATVDRFDGLDAVVTMLAS